MAKGVKSGKNVKSVKPVKFTKKSVNFPKGGAKLVNSKIKSKVSTEAD